MPEPSGNLVTPVGINADGFPRAGNLPLTYHSSLMGELTLTKTGAGWETAQSAAVPADYLWVITRTILRPASGVVTIPYAAIVRSGTYYSVSGKASIVQYDSVTTEGQMMMIEGDYFWIGASGGAVGHTLRLCWFGYIMGL